MEKTFGLEIVEDNIECKETSVANFSEAVDCIIGSCPPDNTFCLVDIDGTLIEEGLVQYPIICHHQEIEIEDGVKESFERMYSFLGGNLAIFTDRNYKEKILWNSHKVLGVIQSFLDNMNSDIPMFTNLNKQIPGLSFKKCNALVKYIEEKFRDGGNKPLELVAIDDKSYSKGFLLYIAKKLKRDYGITVNITNYLITGTC